MSGMVLSKLSRLALKTLGASIRAARVERRWSQNNLAERIGVSRYSVIAIEKGDPNVAIGAAFEAAAIVGIPLLAEDATGHQKLQRTLENLNSLLPKRIRNKAEPTDDNF